MLKMRVAMLGVLTLFIVSGITASTASAAGPFWHVGGSQLKQGTKQLKLQLKGTAVLKGKAALSTVEIECKNSISEGAAIEGSGQQKPGQDKGRLVFTQCIVKFAGNATICKVVEPIKTNQTKSRLVTFAGVQSKYADLFEPQQGEKFVTLSFINGSGECALRTEPLSVTGKVAAEIVPKEAEVQEGLLNFPETPITKVFAENEQTKQQEEIKVGLFLGVNEAKFSAAYGGRLDDGQLWGVFQN